MSSKENKKLAQKRRAEERARAARQAKMKRIGIGVAVVVVLAALIVLPGKFGGATDEDAETAEETTEESADAVDETAGDMENSDAEDSDEAAADAAPSLDTTVGREVKDGDTVNIDYTGYKDGEAFDGGSTNGAGADLEIGSGTYIDGFESGLIGKKVGDTVDLDLTFPENYGASDLAGADVTFTVTINGIYD